MESLTADLKAKAVEIIDDVEVQKHCFPAWLH
eukprot:SAG31_NODE_799_length_12017_cov_5.478436_8_plen_32_part_00